MESAGLTSRQRLNQSSLELGVGQLVPRMPRSLVLFWSIALLVSADDKSLLLQGRSITGWKVGSVHSGGYCACCTKVQTEQAFNE
jgi:hypothetical protein